MSMTFWIAPRVRERMSGVVITSVLPPTGTLRVVVPRCPVAFTSTTVTGFVRGRRSAWSAAGLPRPSTQWSPDLGTEAVGGLDQFDEPSREGGGGCAVDDGVVEGQGEAEYVPRTQLACHVAGFGGDASDGDHEGAGGDRDSPATPAAEHPDRAHAHRAAGAFEPERVAHHRTPRQGTHRRRQGQERHRGPIAASPAATCLWASWISWLICATDLPLAWRTSNDWMIFWS